MKKLLAITLFLYTALFIFKTTVSAVPPPNFESSIVVNTGLDAPTGFDFAPDGRIFIIQRTGEIRVVKNGQLLPDPFAVLPSIAAGDRGLIGIAFDPDYLSNHYVYFYYTGMDKLNRLVRFNASLDVGTDGPYIIYETVSPSEQLHVGGSIAFGPDGKLYFAVGDNGYPLNAQDLSNPHGKILRINRDGSVPADNPFVGQAGKLPEIWAYGFRNPWRFQFDKLTGKIYGGEVGEADWEEVNRIEKGGNYGHPLVEGACTGPCDFINPIYTYSHNNASSAVTGGPVYRGNLFPSEYQGSYFFGDYAQGFIKRLTLDANGNSTGVFDFDTNSGSVVDIKTDSNGALYYATIFPAVLYKIIYTTGNHQPVANATADTEKGLEPLTVHFSSQGSYDPDNDPITYEWDFGDNTTSTSASPTKTYTQKGTYIAQLKVRDATHTVLSVPIVIQVGLPPVVTLAAPDDGSLYRAGDTIFYTASATDGAGFDLSDAAFTTNIIFHHGTHIHPYLGPLQGNKTGTFTVLDTGEPAADTSFEVIVTATDTNGLSSSDSVTVYPRKSDITYSTNPSGLDILLDGSPLTAPQTITGVVGFKRELRPAGVQLLNGSYYQFDHWSDSGATVHTITIPDSNTTITAFYNALNTFTGEYYSNRTLSGTPAKTRQDKIIDFNWDTGSPDPSIPTDNFSVRWSANQYFSAGRYKFTTTTDDGVRLYIDNQLVIDQWHDQGTVPYEKTVDFTGGSHAIKMEYYDSGGGAVARLKWELTLDQLPPPTPSPTPTGGPTPTSPPALTPTPSPIPASGIQLLTSPWRLAGNSGPAEAYQNISPTALQGKDHLSLTYNLNGNCIIGGDASAIIFDQGGSWHYISLSDYGQNCLNGVQTVNIPLSAFPGLNPAQPVGTFHSRFWKSGVYTIDITSAVAASASTPTPTLTPVPTVPAPTPTGAIATPMPTPTGIITPTPTPVTSIELLTSPWTFAGTNKAIDQYQSISPAVLQGKDTLTLTYNLNGFCALTGDASAIIFDQGGDWHYISLSDYGQNCKNGIQTVAVPLSAFPGLNPTQPVGTFHGRFWYSGTYNVQITSAKVLSSATPSPTPTVPVPTPTTGNPTPTPTGVPSGTQLLTSPWNITGNNNAIDKYQSVPPSVLQGKTSIRITYNLHGLCALTGDASAVIFDQSNDWHYISLSDYGQNCLNGVQTVTIPLSNFPGLNTSLPVGTFHTRFWYYGPYTVDITSATAQ